MKKSLKSILVLMIVFAFAATPMIAVFAADEGDTGGDVGGSPAGAITVTYYNGENVFATDTNYNGTIMTEKPTREGKVFLHWILKGSPVSGIYYPGGAATFNADTELEAVFADKASGSDGIYAVKDGKTVFEFEYNGQYQYVKFSAAQPGNNYDQDELGDGWFMFDRWYTLPFTDWYIDISALTAGGVHAGTFSTPGSGQEGVDLWTSSGITRVDGRYADITPGTVKIYYTINYDMNGGEGEIETQRVYEETANATSSPAVLSDFVPTKEGVTFKGWATDKDATKAEYQPGEEIELSENKVLYAVWEAPNPPTNPPTALDSDTAVFLMTISMAVAVMSGIRSLRRRTNN